jgi:hypothetical protein
VGGFVDLYRRMMGWWSSPAEPEGFVNGIRVVVPVNYLLVQVPPPTLRAEVPATTLRVVFDPPTVYELPY